MPPIIFRTIKTTFLITKTLASNTGRHVTHADDSKIPIMGIGTIQFCIGNKVICLNNVYHVPRLDMSLLLMQIHQHREQGCSFVADHSGCYYTFPDFQIEVDDEDNITVPFTSCHHAEEAADFSEFWSTRCGQRSHAAARRLIYLLCAIRAQRVAPTRMDSTFVSPLHLLKYKNFMGIPPSFLDLLFSSQHINTHHTTKLLYEP